MSLHGQQVYFIGDYRIIPEDSVDAMLSEQRGTQDYLQKVILMPLAPAVGGVRIKDGKTVVFEMAGSTWADLRPFEVSFLFQAKEEWKFSTGPNVRLLVVGDFAA